MLTANDLGYGVALDLVDAGVEVAAVLDLRAAPERPACCAPPHAQRNIRIEDATSVAEALGPRPFYRRRLRIAAPAAKAAVTTRRSRTIDCDLLASPTGFAPNPALAAHAGARLVYDQRTATHAPQALPERVLVAGSREPRFDLDLVLADGARAGRGDARHAGFPPHLPASADALGVTHPWPLFRASQGEGVRRFRRGPTIKDILDTIAAGFDDIQLLKRYSTAGMGPSQGRHSAVNTIRACRTARGCKSEADIGTTTMRPPYSGEKLRRAGGSQFRSGAPHPDAPPACGAGAQMMVAGAWLTAGVLRRRSRTETAIAKEAAAVRTGAG